MKQNPMKKNQQRVEVKPPTLKADRQYTQSQLQQEYNYLQAEKVTKRLLEKGLITLAEFRQIMAENRKTFPTLLAPLMPVN